MGQKDSSGFVSGFRERAKGYDSLGFVLCVGNGAERFLKVCVMFGKRG